MSRKASAYQACSRCGKKRITRNDRANYCVECRTDQLRPPAAWMEHGACNNPTLDPEWWWPDTSDLDAGQTPLALSICRNCNVRQLCLDYAIEHKERHGIWGGLMPAARLALAASRKQVV